MQQMKEQGKNPQDQINEEENMDWKVTTQRKVKGITG